MAAIAALRTSLNYFLEREIQQERLTMAETRKLFGGFDTSAAGDGVLSNLANTAMDAVESALERRRWATRFRARSAVPRLRCKDYQRPRQQSR